MVRQYVGARYVPKLADPVAWASGASYEALTIVTYNNSSYTSKVPVPATVGNPADNPDYWALTGNYNAQVEQYRQETENVRQETENVKINYSKCFNTATNMIADTSLTEGMIVKTLGYNKIADNGGAFYKIYNTKEQNSEHYEKLSNGKYALLVPNGYITPEMFGAIGDGVTDDSDAIEKAFDNSHSVRFASGKKYAIYKSIIIWQTLTNVDFNYCEIVSKTNEPCFKISIDNPTHDYLYFVAKNCNVSLENGGSFIVFNECYYTFLSNIRITGVNNDYPAIKYINGFNHFIKGCLIQGTNKTGIGILFLENTPTVNHTYNQFTNCKVEDCLIQRLSVGVLFKGNTSTGRFDTNIIFNTGFSSCGYAIKSEMPDDCWFRNNAIDTVRIEKSDNGIVVHGNTTIKNLYFYNTLVAIGQNDANMIKLEGVVYFRGTTLPFGETVNNISLSCADVTYSVGNEHRTFGTFEHCKYIPPIRSIIYTKVLDLALYSDVIYVVGTKDYIMASEIRDMLLKCIGSKITFTNPTDHNFNIVGLHEVEGTLTLLASSQTQSRSLTFTAKDENTIVYW